MIILPEKDYKKLLDKASKADELEFHLKQYQSALAQAEKQIIQMSGESRFLDTS